eukprot:1876749-Rhodomonas_salina.2
MPAPPFDPAVCLKYALVASFGRKEEVCKPNELRPRAPAAVIACDALLRPNALPKFRGALKPETIARPARKQSACGINCILPTMAATLVRL